MINKNQPVKWEKVYIFISSTFNDMHAERDYLVKKVFPRLSEWCERRKINLLDIDLRWGVTEADATQNKNVVKVCLDRIDACRPFFVCFLGQRYGWVPRVEDISYQTFKAYPSLKKEVDNGASLTELEIIHSILKPFHSESTIQENKYKRSEHAYFYIRDDSYLDYLPKEPWYLRRIYADIEEKDIQEKDRLEKKREKLIKEKIKKEKQHVYSVSWDINLSTPEIAIPLQCPATIKENQERWRQDWLRQAGVQVSGLDVRENPIESKKAENFNEALIKGRLGKFSCEGRTIEDVIKDDLTQAIEDHFPDHQEVVYEDELQKEIDQQEYFVFINTEGFVTRHASSEMFASLNKYVESDSNNLFVLTAGGGMGKSTLLTNWVNKYKVNIRNKSDSSFHYRFIGASDGATTVYSLLRLLLREIKEVSGKLDEEIPDDPIKLRNALPELLKQIGQKGKTILVIDALNQLETGLSDLTWLPRELPGKIKLIVSFKRGEKEAEDLYKSFATDDRVYLQELTPFNQEKDRRNLLNAYLSMFLKELDESLSNILVNLPAAKNPLYLKIILSELRVFGAFQNLQGKIQKNFGETPESAFDGVLQRLELDPTYSPIEPKKAVSLIFGLIAHARKGLSGDELINLLIQAIKIEGTEEEKREAVSDTVYLYLRQVRPFLARRDGRFDFFYESFRKAALRRYVRQKEKGQDEIGEGISFPLSTQEWHGLLASYFYRLPLWLNDKLGEQKPDHHNPPNSRKVSELPYHLTMAEDWNRVEEVLCDLCFIEAKCLAGMTYDLIKDYDETRYVNAADKFQNSWKRVDKFRKFIMAQAFVIHENPDIVFQQALLSIEPFVQESATKIKRLAPILKPILKKKLPVDHNMIDFYTIRAHDKTIRACRFFSNPLCVLTCAQDGYLVISDPILCKVEQSIKIADKACTDLDVNMEKKTVWLCADGKLYQYDSIIKKLSMINNSENMYWINCKFSESMNTVLLGSAVGILALYECESKKISIINKTSDLFERWYLSDMNAVGISRSTAYLYDLTSKCHRYWNAEVLPTAIAFHPDGLHMAAALPKIFDSSNSSALDEMRIMEASHSPVSVGTTLQILDTKLNVITQSSIGGDLLNSIHYTSDGCKIYGIGGQHKLRIWSHKNATLLKEYKLPGTESYCCELDTNIGLLATGGSDGMIRIVRDIKI